MTPNDARAKFENGLRHMTDAQIVEYSKMCIEAGIIEPFGRGRQNRCWDCGSTFPYRHTVLCDMAESESVRDLPLQPGTQWWDGTNEDGSMTPAQVLEKSKTEWKNGATIHWDEYIENAKRTMVGNLEKFAF